MNSEYFHLMITYLHPLIRLSYWLFASSEFQHKCNSFFLLEISSIYLTNPINRSLYSPPDMVTTLRDWCMHHGLFVIGRALSIFVHFALLLHSLHDRLLYS